MQNATTIKLTIESKLENVFLIGLAVGGICSHTPLNETDVFQVKLCVVEAVNNVIKHAYTGNVCHDVDICVELRPDRISFQICDTGKTFEYKKRIMADFDSNDLKTIPEGGMGIPIIYAVMNDVDYNTSGGKNILTLCKHFG